MTNNLDDGYMGSGKLIRRAIKKHGLENFKKEILHVFDNEEDMNNKEKELVIVSEETYNICEGGKGGFGYINKNPDMFLTTKRLSALREYGTKAAIAAIKQKLENDPSFKEKLIKNAKKGSIISKLNNPNGTFFGRNHSEKTRKQMSTSAKNKHNGSKNSQFGTCWITNLLENKKIKKTDLDEWLNKGYKLGRIIF